MIYEWLCTCGHRETTLASAHDRDRVRPAHNCGGSISRQLGGRGLLYFEEGRERRDTGLGGPPIRSWGERARRMRQAGVSEAGDYVPKAVRDNPQTLGMQRHLSNDSKRRWI